jgi:hypothetical protein
MTINLYPVFMITRYTSRSSLERGSCRRKVSGVDRTPVPGHLVSSAELATQPQKDLIRKLLLEKDLLKSPQFFDAVNAMDSEEYEAYLVWLRTEQVEKVSKKAASEWIKKLLELPKLQSNVVMGTESGIKSVVKVQYETITDDSGKERKIGKVVLPDGRTVLEGSYGVDTEDDERFTNKVSFFRVWIAEGYGKGWGIKMYTSDYTHRVNLAVPTQIDVIVWIADDPLGAAKLFGHEFKRCGVCYRGLTKDESRAAGIGPVCGARLGIHVY